MAWHSSAAAESGMSSPKADRLSSLVIALAPASRRSSRPAVRVRGDPVLDCCSCPYAPRCELDLGGGEVGGRSGDLVNALSGDTQQLGDLRSTHEVVGHNRETYRLTCDKCFVYLVRRQAIGPGGASTPRGLASTWLEVPTWRRIPALMRCLGVLIGVRLPCSQPGSRSTRTCFEGSSPYGLSHRRRKKRFRPS